MATEEQRIVVRLGVDGMIDAETVGIKGPQCLDYIAVLEDLLDAEALESSFTHEYLESTQPDQREVTNDVRQF